MAYDSEALMAALSRFARLLPTSYEVSTALDELVGSVTSVLGLIGAGVTLESDGKLRFVTAASEAVAELERCQELAQEGPCVEAHDSGQVVAVPDLETELARWPQYTAIALQHGIFAVAGIPMQLGGNKIGAVNLYQNEPRGWPEGDLEAAKLLADMATGYVVNANLRNQQQQLTEQLRHALDSRIIIEQAKGIIANRHGVGLDEAFALIRKYARAQQTSLHAVTFAIVEVGLRI
ncbi:MULTISPECIES: GAF and ANTAR domain-containing protein [unclassified Nocardia]|uniref:GAF and ANTAR domain-containing protein n=1 Tax=unclassified Nocardia TaxID=2637762 RepID=UPI001CE47F1B|nr:MULTISPECIES: GAF and ANTAR domain-containing protein [unclassified Nocardia]